MNFLQSPYYFFLFIVRGEGLTDIYILVYFFLPEVMQHTVFLTQDF